MQRRYLYKAITLICCLLGAVFIYLFTKLKGVGISPDSVFYISVAENIQAKGTLADFNGKPFIDFPAGYPAFIALFNFITHLSTLNWVHWINMFLFGCLIFAAANYYQQSKNVTTVGLFILLSLIITNPALLEVYSMLWSETVFLLLVMFFLLQLNRYHYKPTNKKFLVLIIITGLAAVCRYAGISLIGFGALVLLFQKQNLKQRILNTSIFILGSSVLLVINLLRNHLVSTTITGLRKSATENMAKHIERSAAVISEWFGIGSNNPTWLMLTGILFLLILFVITIYFFKKYFLLAVLTGFSFFYTAFIIITASITKYEPINNRLLSPIIICLYLIPIILLNQLMLNSNKKTKIAGIVIFLSLFIHIQYKNFTLNYETWDGVKDAGIPGYTEQMWDDMQVVQWLKTNKPLLQQKPLFANANEAVYFFTSLPCTQLPQKEFDFQINKFLSASTGYLIWLNEGDNPELISLDFILQTKKMVLLHKFDEGAVYSW